MSMAERARILDQAAKSYRSMSENALHIGASGGGATGMAENRARRVLGLNMEGDVTHEQVKQALQGRVDDLTGQQGEPSTS
jgi:predicted rRNA methylase YqxC with S4 and FtsJ domains